MNQPNAFNHFSTDGSFLSKRILNLSNTTLNILSIGEIKPDYILNTEELLQTGLVKKSGFYPFLYIKSHLQTCKLPEYEESTIILTTPLVCSLFPKRKNLFYMTASLHCPKNFVDTFNQFTTFEKLFS